MEEEKLKEIIRECILEILNESTTIPGKINLGSRKGSCTIRVLGNEGSGFPHFHIESTKGNLQSVCIGLYEAKYFKHSHGWATLSPNEIAILSNKLDELYKNNPIEINGKMYNLTNWEYMAYNYDLSNNLQLFDPENSRRPNYFSSMPDIKDKVKK